MVSKKALEISKKARFPATISTGFGVNPYLLIAQLNAWFPMHTLVIAPSKNKPLAQLACGALLNHLPSDGAILMEAFSDGGAFLQEALNRGVRHFFILLPERFTSDDFDWYESMVEEMVRLPEQSAGVILITKSTPSSLYKNRTSWLREDDLCYPCPSTFPAEEALALITDRMGACISGDSRDVLAEAREVKKNRLASKGSGNAPQDFSQLDLFQAFDNLRFKAAQ